MHGPAAADTCAITTPPAAAAAVPVSNFMRAIGMALASPAAQANHGIEMGDMARISFSQGYRYTDIEYLMAQLDSFHRAAPTARGVYRYIYLNAGRRFC
jgi:hypothetical protein